MFPYGTQYYRAPTPARGDWVRDLKAIREHNFGVVKLWLMWTSVHLAPGKFDFGEFDDILDLADRYGLKVVAQTVLENCPYWLDEMYPEARYVAVDGTVMRPDAFIHMATGGWPGLCFHHEAVKRAAEEFLSAVASRYRHHPAMYVYECWNEPFLEPTYIGKIFCYCQASTEAYRHWLLERYRNLDSLCRAWAMRFSSWEQVRPPHFWGGLTNWIDWRRFWVESLTNHLKWRVETIRKSDPEHRIATHPSGPGTIGGLGRGRADEFQLAKHVDILGLSSFPKWFNVPNWLHFLHLEVMRTAASGKNFWQTELQGGRGMGQRADVNLTIAKTPTATVEDIRVWNWNVLAAGGKGLIYWCWRDEYAPMMELGSYGLCDLAGSPSSRAEVASKFARFADEHSNLLLQSRVIPSESGILLYPDSQLFLYASEAGDDTLYTNSILGTYKAHYDSNRQVDFVYHEQLKKEVNQYNVVFLPAPIMLGKELAEDIKEYVKSGGTIISDALPALYHDKSWESSKVPGLGLDEVFGCESHGWDHLDSEVKLIPDADATLEIPETAAFTSEFVKEVLSPTTGTVIGRFSDGMPALIANKFGNGHAILAGTLLGYTYWKREDETLRQLIVNWGQKRNNSMFSFTAKPPKGVVTRLHDLDEGFLLYIVNHTEQSKEVKVHLNVDFSKAKDLLSGKALPVKEPKSVEVHLVGNDGAAIHLTS